MQKVSSERIAELDILRALAIFAVILIHTISGALYSASWSSDTFKFYLILDQFCRFSVPLFVGLSGYTLTLRYKDSAAHLSEFFKRRVWRLIPWYLFWSLIIFLYIRFSVFGNSAPSFPLWKVIFLGKADYHLYFVPMIFQLYVLFPLLLLLVKRVGRRLLVPFFLLELAFYFLLSEYAVGRINLPVFQNDQQQYIFFGTWIFYFVLGVYLAIDSHIVNFVRKYKLLFLSILFFAFCWEFFNTFNLLNLLHDLTLATRSTRIPVLIYATSFCVVVISGMRVFNILPRRLYKQLVLVGQRSYVIYLLHTLPLRVFSSYVKPSSLFYMFLLFVLTAITSDYLAQVSLLTSRYIHAKFFYRRVNEF